MTGSSFGPTKVLVTVMTYPHPSAKYQELICTAGITEAGDWVRLYPIDFRYRPQNQQFRKYQWIEIGLSTRGDANDPRKESRKPDLESIRILGPPLPTSQGWRERRELVDPLPARTVNQLHSLYEKEKVSLGVVRPSRVLDLKVEPANPEWKPQWQALFNELRLFGPQQKPLRKLPYKFVYQFECEDSRKPHNAMVIDWELGVLWLKEAERLGSERAAAESVRAKYLEELCRQDKDTRFFMGTVLPWNTWLVLGVFWPPGTTQLPKEADQPSLFGESERAG